MRYFSSSAFFSELDFWSGENDVSWGAHLPDEVVFGPLISGVVVFFHHCQCVLVGEEVAAPGLSFYIRIHRGLVVEFPQPVEYRCS